MPRRVLFHPFLFSLFPILSFWVTNKNFVFLAETWRTLLICLIGIGLVYLIIWLVNRNNEKSALLSSLIAVTFLYFGHIYNSIKGRVAYLELPLYFSTAWLLFFLLGLYAVIRLCKQCESFNTYLNWMSLILVVFPLGQIAYISFAHRVPAQAAPGDVVVNDSIEVTNISPNQPDIYYFILDGYGRGDILVELYSFDNTAFLDSLEQRGFYIADQSTSNYIQTHLSLSASLTGNYLEAAKMDPSSEDRTLIHDYLSESPHFQRFHQLGYQIIALKDPDSSLQLDAADEMVSSYKRTMNNFEIGFYDLTLGKIWSPTVYEYLDWEIIRSQLDILENFPTESDKPRFVFAHLLIPHPPFVFDKNGDFVATNLYMAGDGSHYGDTADRYILGYTGQLQYLNYRLIKIVDHLLANQNRPAVIILQGDHGPGAYLDWESLENTCLRERLSIFNAYYFPDEAARAKLYPSISPVNSFRVVFDQILNQPMPLLEDRSYYSMWSRPFDPIDVTDSKNSCSPLK